MSGRAAGAVGVTDTPEECSSEIWVLNLISGLNLSFSPNLSGFACTKLLHLLGCVGSRACFPLNLVLCSLPFLFIFLLTYSLVALCMSKPVCFHGLSRV